MNKNIIKRDYIFLDIDLKTQKEVFEFIAKKGKELGIITNQKSLVNGFLKRESEGSTGFEEGFAIPHARIKEVKQAAVFVLRFKNGIEWNSMDGQDIKVAIGLLVPDGPSGDEHLSILSDVAIKLMDDDFKNSIKAATNPTQVIDSLSKNKKNSNESEPIKNDDEKKLNIIAITACAVGIAHTYMAEDKLLKAGRELGYNIRVETHGSKGVGTPFKQTEIDNADVVIFATDVNVDNKRFNGKKFYWTPVAKAIKDPQGIINQAIENGEILKIENSKNDGFSNKNGKASVAKQQGVLQHILAGISYMIPVIVLGGIALAFSLGVAKAIWGPGADPKGPPIAWDTNGNPTEWKYPWNPLAVLNIIGGAAFTLMIPILAGFIANSIAGRAAIAPAMVGAFIGNNAANFMPMPGMSVVQTPTGFIGALISGILVGYFVRWVNTWNVHKSLAPAMPIFFIPLIAGIGISVLFIYVIGGPIGFVMEKFSIAIQNAYSGKVGIGVGLALGALLGAMAGFDMGGPINKVAFITASALVTEQIYQPMGAMAAAIPVAPLAMGITTLAFKRFFNDDEKNLGIAAIIMGTIGISEGAIPFAIRDPRRAIPSNVVGSMVAGAIAGAFGVTNQAAHGGPIVAILGAVPYGTQTLYFFIAIIAGTLVTTMMYGTWMLFEAGKIGSVKETHVNHLNILRNWKKEEIQKNNEEIHILKKEFRKNKDLKRDNLVKIEDIKRDNLEIKLKFKNSKHSADEIFKIIEKNEEDGIKLNKIKILEEKRLIKNQEKQQIEEVKNRKDKDNLKKIKFIKENGLKKRNEIDINYRSSFVKEYNQKINNL